MRATLATVCAVMIFVVGAADARGPIAGAPAATPAWLTAMAWRQAANLGDPHPEKIAISLDVVDRYGRTFDRVWMRGHFTVPDIGMRDLTVQARLVGFTVDPKTRLVHSFSLHH